MIQNYFLCHSFLGLLETPSRSVFYRNCEITCINKHNVIERGVGGKPAKPTLADVVYTGEID